MTVHHAYRSGFLEHILSVARSALRLGAAYGANQDLLTAGALLHDIGKLDELEYDRATAYTREGNLVGHVTLGVMMARAAMTAIPDFPDVLRTQIEHLAQFLALELLDLVVCLVEDIVHYAAAFPGHAGDSCLVIAGPSEAREPGT